MPIHTSPSIEIKYTPRKGRGVFAREFIAAGTEFERVPVIVMPEDDVMNNNTDTVIQRYVFEWGRGKVALALGFGSMYNHSYKPNARYDDIGRMTKVFSSVTDIHPGDEITINYNGHEDGTDPVSFDVVEESAKKSRKLSMT